jgi:type IV secretory pathway component VirB8
MSNDFSRHAIAAKVQTGEYFKEARNWYAVKYISIKSQGLAWAIFCGISVASAFILLKTLSLNYTPQQYPFAVYFHDSVRYFPQILPISQPNDASTNISIARYMLGYYVKIREEYNPLKISQKDWDNKKARVEKLSSKRILSGYQDSIDPTINPDSPIILYKDNTERVITVDRIVFTGGELVPYEAEVYYTATETSRESRTSSRWISRLKFSMGDVEHTSSDSRDLQFIVTSYETTQLT